MGKEKENKKSVETEKKKTAGEKFTDGMKNFAHGIGTLIQGTVVASDKMLNFAQTTKEKTAQGSLIKKKKSRFHVDERQDSILFEKEFREGEFEEMTKDQDEDEYFGITAPQVTAPKVSVGLRNSFGDFFGSSADAMERSNISEVKKRREERRR